MITKIEALQTLNAHHLDQFALNNGKYVWNFLDEYTFSKMAKDNSSPSYSSEAEGILLEGKSNYGISAKLIVTEHRDIKKWSATVYTYDDNDKIDYMIDITKIEKTK